MSEETYMANMTETELTNLMSEIDDMQQRYTLLREDLQLDRDWLERIVKAYDRTTVTVPTEFDSKIEELRLYLNKY